MKCFIILSTCIFATVLARPQQYGVPSNSGSARGYSASRSISTGSRSIGQGNNAQQGYSLGSSNGNNNGGGSYNGNSIDSGSIAPGIDMGSLPDGPKVFKHISIHVPPADEFEVPTRRVIRPMMASDKHVNIIFVKAPSGSSNQQTEVILPEEPQRRTVVYILVKKRDSQNDVKIRQPMPTRPPKPEVFFIRYAKGSGVNSGSSGSSGSAEVADAGQVGPAPSTPGVGTPSQQYGV